MKRFLSYFVKRPVAAAVLHLGIFLLGLKAVTLLPIIQYPLFNSSSIIIKTTYVGAPAKTMRGFVTTPIERAVSATPGLDYVESKSVAGTSTVVAKLKLGIDGARSLADVMNRVDQIRNELPSGAQPPRIEVQRGDRPWATFFVALTSDTLTLAQLSEFASRDVQSALAGIPGVQRISPLGATPRAMRIWLDVGRMSAHGVDAVDIRDALRRNNYVSAIGQARSESIAVNLHADTDLVTEADFHTLIVRQTSGGVVRLGDVARVEIGTEEKLVDARVNRTPAIYLEIWPLPGVSELAVDVELRKRLEGLEATLPPGVRTTIAYNATTYMRDSLIEIGKTLAETVLIVAVVVLLFLGSMRYALVPLAAVPLSLVGTGAVMWLLGMSLNTLTLLAIVLSIGLVVDDAIIVVESVQGHIRVGRSPQQAALLSVRRLAAPIIAMTVTLAVVYAPIGFLDGLSGILLREFALTLACAVIVSGFVALTLSPAMSAWASGGSGRNDRPSRAVGAAMARLADRYGDLLRRALTARRPILVVSVFLCLLIPALFAYSAREMAPVEDQGEIDFVASASAVSTIDYIGNTYVDPLVSRLEKIPGADYVWLWTEPQQGIAALMLKEWRNRPASASELLMPAAMAVAEIPGIQFFPVLPSSLPAGGSHDVEVIVAGNGSPQELEDHAGALMAAAMRSGKLMYVDTDVKLDLPVSKIEIDREKAASLGLDIDRIGGLLEVMVSGDYVGYYNSGGHPYKVIPQVERDARVSDEDLLGLNVRTPMGESVPIASIAAMTTSVEARSLNRFQQTDGFRIMAGGAPGVTKETALTAVEDAAAKVLPTGYRIDYAGESRQIREQGLDMIWIGLIGLILIYLILVLQFDDFVDPLVILLGSVPLGLAGALMLTFFDVTTINLYSQVGLITMVGLVSKNGILMIELARHMHHRGVDRATAIRQAAEQRLRPILMTTIATVVGHMPLVFVTGPGSGARNSIGIVLVAGMGIGTVFTLIVLPCLYASVASRSRVET